MSDHAQCNCCEFGKEHIYMDWSADRFYIFGLGDLYIEYCPWCGILLDTNLLED